MIHRLLFIKFIGVLALALCLSAQAIAQPPTARVGEVVPRDVREMYDRGLQFLATTQNENGDWADSGGQQGPGVTGFGLMVFLASGEDPNFGLYSNHVRKALRNIINAQDASTGIMGISMYHHGFAMLSLAEAYGAVDERTLWPDKKGPQVDRPGTRAGGASGGHLAKEKPARCLALFPAPRPMPTRRSAARSWSVCSRHETPASKYPTSRSTKPSPTTSQMTSASGQVAYAGAGRLRRVARANLDRDAGLFDLSPQGSQRIQGDARLSQAAPRNHDPADGPNIAATTRPRPSSKATSPPGRSGTSF